MLTLFAFMISSGCVYHIEEQWNKERVAFMVSEKNIFSIDNHF